MCETLIMAPGTAKQQVLLQVSIGNSSSGCAGWFASCRGMGAAVVWKHKYMRCYWVLLIAANLRCMFGMEIVLCVLCAVWQRAIQESLSCCACTLAHGESAPEDGTEVAVQH